MMAMSTKLHSSSLLYLVISLLCMLAFFIVGIYPNIKDMKELEDTIARLNEKTGRQELLFPVYTRLIKEIQSQPPALPLPQKARLDHKEIAGINAQFSRMAEKNGVIFDSATPDATSYLEDSDQLIINLSVHGDFFNFQNLLWDIYQIPYLSAIDELGIYSQQEGKQMKLKMRLDQE